MAVGIWTALVVSLVGIFYAVFLGIFLFVAHLTFITHLRGSAVRLGPDQMPELYNRVATLAQRIGLHKTPQAYVVQAGGTLNALATRFLGSNFIVLYSDLLEACGDNTDARDFIIAHELGHLHAGHLRLRWLLAPGLFVPFLGAAYSRACEYTCDRYGLAAGDDAERALDGLCILAAGREYGPAVNRRALVAQRSDLNSILMKIGHWLSSHPPIAHRVGALQPSLSEGNVSGMGAAVAAATLLVLLVLTPVFASVAFVQVWPQFQAALKARQASADAAAPADDLPAQAEAGILSLAGAADSYRAVAGVPPTDVEQLYREWSLLHPEEAEPLDPYDGGRFGYEVENGEYTIWSSGPDPADTSDDLYYSSESAKGQ